MQRTVSPVAVNTALNLPPLRVDPALLGIASAPKQPMPVVAETSPLQAKPATAPVAAEQRPRLETITAVKGGAEGKLSEPVHRQAQIEAATIAEKPATQPVPESKTKPAASPQIAADESAPSPLSQQPPLVEDRAPLPPLYSAHAEAGLPLMPLPEPTLKFSTSMQPAPPKSTDSRPVFIAANHVHGQTDVEMVAVGDAELRKIGSVLTADQLVYRDNDDEVEATGHVRLAREGEIITGPKLRLKLEESIGSFDEPVYMIRRSRLQEVDKVQHDASMQRETRVTVTGYGVARRIDFEGEDKFRLSDATYSTCGPTNPDWFAEVSDLKLDYTREVAEGSDAKLVFKGVPILYTPWLSFSLNNQRKSGLLTPTLGSTSNGGFEITTPFYWNIAPNMDATIAPRVMAKRGVQMMGEFRYLDYNYEGTSRVEWLNDQVTDKRRSAYSINHNQDFGYGIKGNLNLNGVSDDSYFTDLSGRQAIAAQAFLLRQGSLSYSGGWWNVSALASRYQTLQLPGQPLLQIPYDRLPQVTLTANQPDIYGSSLALNGEYVNFSHPTLVVGRRFTAYPQVSLPLQTGAAFVTPKIGLHMTRYDLERQGIDTPGQLRRNVPIFSVDSGVVFDRNLDWFGRGLTQTLEPRLYYLYVPKRDQSLIPVFDSGLADLNFAQIFGENRYSGGDRIGDANQLTAAVTSRLLDPGSGAELLRGTLGQRYYFSGQNVTLPGEIVRTERSADILAALSGQVAPKIWFDTGVQYNPRDSRTERLNLGGRYQPEIGKVLNAGYRYQRDSLRLIDVSGQWPIWGGWRGVGRYNYSLKENRLVESVAGIEYDGGCWVIRTIMQRYATTAGSANTSFFIQLELSDFSRIGSNPFDMLKRNIPGYGRTSRTSSDPVFGAD